MTASVAVRDTNFLASYLIGTRVYGVVVPPGSPPEFACTYEISGDQGTLFMAAVLGPDGPAGADSFAMHLQTDPYDTADQLPQTLTNTPADIGKYWVIDDIDNAGEIIGASMWVWFGTSWRRLMLGSPGPPGPVPIITPHVTLVAKDANPRVIPGGTPLYPTWDLELPAIPGPQGPGAALALSPDVDLVTNPPEFGDVLGHMGRFTTGTPRLPIWVPVSVSQLLPSPYSMPENAFTSFSGLSARAAIGSFQIPPQPFPWTPVVWGHIGAWGVELSLDNPLLIGCEVLLGSATAGVLIGRGFGNSLGEVNIMPHYSTPSTPSVALTPSNGRAVVPANHSNPAEGTIYVNLANDGTTGLYQFSPTDAQIFVMIVPVSENAETTSALYVPTVRKRR